MASIGKLEQAKDGRRYWLIRVRMGRGDSTRKTRFYWPEKKDGTPVSETTALRQRDSFAAEFERQCKAGEVLSREQKKEAAAQAEAERAKLKTVKQYAESVFMPAKEITVTENTRSNYQQYLDNQIYPAIGDCLLTDVTPAMLTGILLDYQKKGFAHSSCIKLYNILKGLFEMAFLDDSVPISPMLKVKRPGQKKEAVKKPESEKALTAEEAHYVLSCVEAEYKAALNNVEQGNDVHRSVLYSALLWLVYINLSADSGARRGEMCALQWDDIDWKNKTITISRNLQYTSKKGVYVDVPKNGKTRTVDIGDGVIAMLKTLQLEQSHKQLSPWVFSQENSRVPIHPQSPTRYFKKFGERHNIPNFHPHLLRHTYASIAITHGADVVSVSQRLGHSDTAVTLRMYAHANEESMRAAGQTARDAIRLADGKQEMQKGNQDENNAKTEKAAGT